MLNRSLNKYPSYLNAYYNGSLEELIKNSFKLLESCCICPRKCKVNRIKNKKGACNTGLLPKVYSFMAHYGEEPPISGTKGSGTIFFSGCNMSCVYCQNYEFSQLHTGKETSFEELADFMLKLQNIGCHNINLVTPTHIMPQILKAISIAVTKGLTIPLLYNTSGYEVLNIIKLLNGIIDIYLTDMRYADNAMSIKYSNAMNYPKFNRAAIKEMHRQTGIAKMDNAGILKKGLIIRHLVLPNKISGTEKIMKFISQNISTETYISLMSQYTPFYKAANVNPRFKEISRRINLEEYKETQFIMEKHGLHNGWTQDSYGLSELAGINIKPI